MYYRARAGGVKGYTYLSMPMITILNHCKVSSKEKIIVRNVSARAEVELQQSARLQIQDIYYSLGGPRVLHLYCLHTGTDNLKIYILESFYYFSYDKCLRFILFNFFFINLLPRYELLLSAYYSVECITRSCILTLIRNWFFTSYRIVEILFILIFNI